MLCEHPQPILDVQAVSFSKSDRRLIVYFMTLESYCWCNLYKELFCHGATVPSEPRPHYRGFTITLRHATVGRTPLDVWSARSRDLYLTTHNTHNTHPCLWPRKGMKKFWKNWKQNQLTGNYEDTNQQNVTLAVLFISNCKITLHVSDASRIHHQEY